MTHDAHPDTADHGHDHGAGHDHGHGHSHSGRGGKIGAALREVFAPHSHDASDSIDGALESSAAGIRAVKISLLALGATSIAQLVIVLISGSVALLADTIHNFSDALTAIPLWIAFALGTKAATRRYTYGFGRAEDIAGTVRDRDDHPVGHHRRDRIDPPPDQPRPDRACRLGRRSRSGRVHRQRTRRRLPHPRRAPIGSAALIADGLHARTDGFTSLAVLFGAGGVALGFPLADPIIGLLITVAILAVLRTAVRDVFRRLMDGVDPALVDSAEAALAAEPGVTEVRSVKMRWIGHRLHADAELDIDPATSLTDAHRIAHEAEHTLTHAVPKLSSALVHAYPANNPTHH